MKSTPDPDTTPEQKMHRFESGLRRVLQVSKTQLNDALEHERSAPRMAGKRGPKPRLSSSGHAASGRD